MLKVAIIIGHKESSPGAKGFDIVGNRTIAEYGFNKLLANHLISKITNNDIGIVVVERNMYSQLPYDVNKTGADVAVSLHCNTYNGKAHGAEVLYWHSSNNGLAVAQILQRQFVSLGLRDRGVKPKTAEDRGGYLLRYTDMVCVIGEPFFIDNKDELRKMLDQWGQLVQAYVDGITEIHRLWPNGGL